MDPKHQNELVELISDEDTMTEVLIKQIFGISEEFWTTKITEQESTTHKDKEKELSVRMRQRSIEPPSFSVLKQQGIDDNL